MKVSTYNKTSLKKNASSFLKARGLPPLFSGLAFDLRSFVASFIWSFFEMNNKGAPWPRYETLRKKRL